MPGMRAGWGPHLLGVIRLEMSFVHSLMKNEKTRTSPMPEPGSDHTPTARGTEIAIASGAAAGSVMYLFRSFLFTGGSRLAGDHGDARLYVVILEHWLAVARGLAPVRDPNFFAPYHDVLGYSDTLFLYAPLFAAARILGFDPYLSFEFTLIAVKLLGFAGLYLLLRGKLGFSTMAAVAGASAFTLANISVTTSSHPQLWMMAVFPMIAWLVLDYGQWRFAGRPRRARWSLCGAAFLLGGTIFSSFYVGFCAILGAGTGGLIWLMLEKLPPGGRPVNRERWRAVAADAGIAAIAFLFWMGPFFYVYLPVLRQTGGRHYPDAYQFMKQWNDVFDVGTHNLVWGGTLGEFYRKRLPLFGESSEGLTPLMVLFAVAAWGVAMRRWWQREHDAMTRDRRLAKALVVLGLTSAALYVLTVRVGIHSWWWVVYHVVPGAAGIRVPGRMNLVVTLALIVMCASAVEWMQRRGWRAAAALVAVLMVTEQVNSYDIGRMNRFDENAYLSRLGAAPADCRQFFALTPRRPEVPVIGEVDAMMLAAERGVATVNGYSGWQPPGWNLDDFGPGYEARVAHYAMRENLLDGMCTADLGSGRWLDVRATRGLLAERLALPADGFLSFRAGGSAPQYELSGWSGAEAAGTWTLGPEARLAFMVAPGRPLRLRAELRTLVRRPAVKVRVMAGNREAAVWQLRGGFEIESEEALIPGEALKETLGVISLQIDKPRSPAELGLSGDTRPLGVFVESMEIVPGG